MLWVKAISTMCGDSISSFAISVVVYWYFLGGGGVFGRRPSSIWWSWPCYSVGASLSGCSYPLLGGGGGYL
jgi:hypothetical protein